MKGRVETDEHFSEMTLFPEIKRPETEDDHALPSNSSVSLHVN
jgi:hypothetical protein